MIKEAAKFEGTVIYDVLTAVDSLYNDIDTDQKLWKTRSPMHCPDGCGSCCVHFEPDVYEAEALYLAAWMLEHQSARAERIAAAADIDTFVGGEGCILFDPLSPHHCTVYEGRCLICRLFGFSGDHGKDGTIRWKPCRYMKPSGISEKAPFKISGNTVDGISGIAAAGISKKALPGIAGNTAAGISGKTASGIFDAQEIQTRLQYGQEDMMRLFGAVPPYMGAASSALLALNPDDTHPHPLRIALPAAIKKLKMLLRFITPPEPDCPSPHPLSA